MNEIYAWVEVHNYITALVVGIVCLALPNTLFVKAGTVFSAMVRKIGGKKLEEKVENLIDGFEQGMKQDADKN